MRHKTVIVARSAQSSVLASSADQATGQRASGPIPAKAGSIVVPQVAERTQPKPYRLQLFSASEDEQPFKLDSPTLWHR